MTDLGGGQTKLCKKSCAAGPSINVGEEMSRRRGREDDCPVNARVDDKEEEEEEEGERVCPKRGERIASGAR